MADRLCRITCVSDEAAEQLRQRLDAAATGVTRTGRDVTLVTDNAHWAWDEALLAYRSGLAESSSPISEALNGDDRG